MKPNLLFWLCLSINSIGFSQSFDWGNDGYTTGSGGGTYLNVDGSGINLTISGLNNDRTWSGSVKTGIDNNAAGREVHVYKFIFSKKVDVKFWISDINGGPGNCGFIDHLGFSGHPILTPSYGAKVVGDSLVIPTDNGSVMVQYYQVESFTIYHGEGVKCNPGFIFISALLINQNAPRVQSEDDKKIDGLTYQNLLFNSDESNLVPSQHAQLDKLIAGLKSNPKLKIRISGYTDSIGDSRYNITLSKKRVEAVNNYLLSKGVAPERIEIVFYGEDNPEAANETSEGRQKNRRVEIEIFE